MNLFPDNAINVRTDISGNSSWTAFTPASGSVYTVLYESMNTSSVDQNGTLELKCGGVTSLKVNSFKNVPAIERFKMAKCSNSLIGTISGVQTGDNTTLSVIYVPYNIASQSLYSSGSFNVSATFSSGDILISLLLFTSIMFSLFSLLKRHS